MPSLPDDIRDALSAAGREFLKDLLNAVSDAAETAADRIDTSRRSRRRTVPAEPDDRQWTMVTAADLAPGWVIRSGDMVLRVEETRRDDPGPDEKGLFGFPKTASVTLHLVDEDDGERSMCSLSASQALLAVPAVPDDASGVSL